jgi:peptidoglycan/xylan/chitin deacetylase (PgdA/CDA1 family)
MSKIHLISYPAIRKKNLYSLPQNLLLVSGTNVQDCEDKADWTVNHGSIDDDAVNYKEGTQGVKVTTDVGDEGEIAISGLGWDGIGDKDFTFWFYCADETKVAAANCYVELWDAVYADKLKYYFYYFDGWNFVKIAADDWTVNGSGSLDADINNIRIRHKGDAGQQAVFTYDAIYMGQAREPAVVLCFDNSNDSVYDTAYPIMRAHNMVGTIYTVTDEVGGGGKCTWAELVELQGKGWVIGNHSEDHTDFTTLTEAQIETNLTNAVTALEANGITGNGPYHVAYPGGGYDADTLAAMADTSMLTGRTIEPARHPALPMDRPYEIPIWFDLDSGTSLATAKTKIDALEAEGKIGYIYGHKIAAVADATTWATADFTELCDYIGSKRMACLTIDDAYQLQSGSVMCRKAR